MPDSQREGNGLIICHHRDVADLYFRLEILKGGFQGDGPLIFIKGKALAPTQHPSVG